MDVGELFVSLGLDQSKFDSGIRSAEGKSRSLGSKLARGVGGAAKLMGKAIFAGVAVAGAGILAFGKKALGIASDLEEVQNVVDTVFESNADVIEDFAKSAGLNFGLSELSAKKMAGTMGALLTPSGLGTDTITEMSTELVGLAGDMASFFNIADEDAFNKLRAGISGETEPLKQLGINMSVANLEAYALSKGIDESFNSMTQAEQATLRYQFIMDATSKVQGDFAKTSESLANQQRIAALNVENLGKVFGNVLLPQAGKAMLGINSLITNLMPQFEGLAEGLGGILDGEDFGKGKFQESANNIVEGLIGGLERGLPKVLDILVALIPVIVQALSSLIPKLIEMISEQIPTLIEAFVGILPILIDALVDFIPMIIEQGIAILSALIDGIYEAVPLLIEGAFAMIIALANGLVEFLPLMVDKIPVIIIGILDALMANLPILIEAALNIILTLINGLVGALPLLIGWIPNIINKILGILIINLPTILKGAIEIIMALIDGLISAIPLLVESIPFIIESIVAALITMLPEIATAAVEIILALVTTMLENIPMILDAIFSIGGALIQGIIDLIPQLWEAGKDLIKGLVEGLKSIDLMGVLGGIADSIIGGFKSLFGIASKSKVMKKEIGRWLLPGIGSGVEDEAGNLMSTINRSVSGVVEGLSIPQIGLAGAGAGEGSIGNITFDVNVTLASGSPEEAREAGEIIAETAAERLVEAKRRRGI